MEFTYVMVDLIHNEVLFASKDKRKLIRHLLSRDWFQRILENFNDGEMVAEFGMNWKQEIQTDLYLFNMVFEDCVQIVMVPLV